MNKTKKYSFAVLLLPLLLTSCGNDATKLPNKGTEITAEEGKTQLKKAFAVDAEVKDDASEDALGISIKDVSLGIDGNRTISGSKPSGLKLNASVSDIGLELAVKGFTSTHADDLEYYARATGKVSYKANYTESTKSTEYSKNLNLDSSVYADNEERYLDLSNSDLVEVIGPLTKVLTLPKGKYKTDNPLHFSDSNRPLISVDKTSNDSAICYNQFEEFLVSGAEKGVFKSHGNDVYSYSYTLNAEDFKNQIRKALENIFGQAAPTYDRDSTDITNKNREEIKKSLTVDNDSKVSFSAVFNSKKGIQSIGYSGNFKVSVDTTSIVEKDGAVVKGELSQKSTYKIEFTRGKDVVLHGVTNKDSYHDFPEIKL